MISAIESLASHLMLGDLLDELTRRFGGYDLVAHWTQGEFHHDVVVKVPGSARLVLPGSVVVVATNCNGGVKEVLCFADEPSPRRSSGITAARKAPISPAISRPFSPVPSPSTGSIPASSWARIRAASSNPSIDDDNPAAAGSYAEREPRACSPSSTK